MILKKKLLFVCPFLLILSLQILPIVSSNVDNNEINESKYRKGFKQLYSFANAFIDSMTPDYPEFLIVQQNEPVDDYFDRVLKHYENLAEKGGWQAVTKEALATFSRLFTFIVFSLLFVIVIPLFGCCYCCCSCCCSKCCSKKDEFEEYDEKNDKTKRTIYTFILFVLLVLLLLLGVVLFTTNTYANNFVHDAPERFVEKVEDIKNFIIHKTFDYFNNITSSLDDVTNSSLLIYKGAKDKFKSEVINNTKNRNDILLKNIKDKLISPLEINSELNTLVNSSKIKEWNTAIESLILLNSSFATGLGTLPKFDQLDSYNNLTGFINDTLSTNLQVEKLEEFLTSNINGFDGDINSTINTFSNELNEILDSTHQSLVDVLNKLDSIDTDVVIDEKRYIFDYYNYYYYSLIGISSFMILLLVLYLFGVFGICCHRKGNSGIHRGIAANCMMSGFGLFCIFSGLLMLICFSTFSAGILARQLGCRPLIDLDDHIFVQNIKRIKEVREVIGYLSVKELIKECRTTDFTYNSDQIDNLLYFHTGRNFEFFRNVTSYLKLIEDKLVEIYNDFTISQYSYSLNLPNITSLFNDIGGDKNINVTNLQNNINNGFDQYNTTLTFIKTLEETNQGYNDSIAQIRHLSSEYLSVLNSLNNSLSNYSKFMKEKNTTIHEIDDEINFFTNQSNFRQFVINSLEKTNNEYTLPNIKSEISKLLDQAFNNLPSCKIVSSLYDEVTIASCYEYIDNYNGYWFALWFTLFLHILVFSVAICLTKLLRKKIPYESKTQHGEPRRRKDNNRVENSDVETSYF